MTYIKPTGGFGQPFTQNELVYMKNLIERDLHTTGCFGKLISLLDEAANINGAKIKELESQAQALKGEELK